jgi:hypothetical protein
MLRIRFVKNRHTQPFISGTRGVTTGLVVELPRVAALLGFEHERGLAPSHVRRLHNFGLRAATALPRGSGARRAREYCPPVVALDAGRLGVFADASEALVGQRSLQMWMPRSGRSPDWL